MGDKIFAYPLRIKGNREQLFHIKDELIKIGYKFDHMKYYEDGDLITSYDNDTAGMGFWAGWWADPIKVLGSQVRTTISANHLPLILMLAKACVNDRFQSGEPIILESNESVIKFVNGIAGLLLKDMPSFKRATIEQIFSYYNNTEMLTDTLALPEKWAIKRTEENHEVVNNYFNKLKNVNLISSNDYVCYTCQHSYVYPGIPKGYTEITFEQFEKYVIKENKMPDKKIIGYKLKDDKYKSAAENILDGIWNTRTLEYNIEHYGWCFRSASGFRTTFENLGLLDLWFEPVYQQDEIEIFDLGSYKNVNLKIKNKQIFYGEHNVTDKVNLIHNQMKSFGELLGYDISFPSVKIGCSAFTFKEIEDVIKIAEK